MERIDPQKAARVWQRVQGESNVNEGILKELILEESMTATGWKQLARNSQGQRRQMLEQMERQGRERIACMRGICDLLTGKKPEVPNLPQPHTSAQALMRAGYGRLMKCLARYEALQADTTYGPAFVPMVAQTRDHCRNTLALLGSNP